MACRTLTMRVTAFRVAVEGRGTSVVSSVNPSVSRSAHGRGISPGAVSISRPVSVRSVVVPPAFTLFAHGDFTGFGVRVHPSGAKSFLVNYRVGNGRRKAPNKRVVVGRAGRITLD